MARYVRQSPRNTVKSNTKKIHRNGSNYSRKKGNEPNKPTFGICEYGNVTSMTNENSCVPEHGGCSTSIGNYALTNPARITAGSGPKGSSGGSEYWVTVDDWTSSLEPSLGNTRENLGEIWLCWLLTPFTWFLRFLYCCLLKVVHTMYPDGNSLFPIERAYMMGAGGGGDYYDPQYAAGNILQGIDEEDVFEDEVLPESGFFIRRRRRAAEGDPHLRGRIDVTQFTPKSCPVADSGSSWDTIQRNYESWLKQCDLDAEVVMDHIHTRGFCKNPTLLASVETYLRENPGAFFQKRVQTTTIVGHRLVNPPAGETPSGPQKIKLANFTPKYRKVSRIPLEEDEDAREVREATEAQEDEDALEQHITDECAKKRWRKNEYSFEYEESNAKKTGKTDNDFPAWARFKQWMRARFRHDKPIQKMKRLTKWLRKTRKHGERFDDFIDDWLRERQEVKDDGYFWKTFEGSDLFQILNLVINLDLPTTSAIELFKEMDITSEDPEKLKASLTIENLRKYIETKINAPADYNRRGPERIKMPMRGKSTNAPVGNFVDHAAGGYHATQMTAFPQGYAINTAPMPAFWSGGGPGQYSPADYGFIAVPPLHSSPPQYEEYDPDLADWVDDELGTLDSGEYLDQGFGHLLAAFLCEGLSEVVFYDEDQNAYLLKNQCAKCGEFNHFHANCPNPEREFPGKTHNKPKNHATPGKAKRPKAMQAEAQDFFLRKKGSFNRRFNKGRGKGKSKGKGKEKGFEAEEVVYPGGVDEYGEYDLVEQEMDEMYEEPIHPAYAAQGHRPRRFTRKRKVLTRRYKRKGGKGKGGGKGKSRGKGHYSQEEQWTEVLPPTNTNYTENYGNYLQPNIDQNTLLPPQQVQYGYGATVTTGVSNPEWEGNAFTTGMTTGWQLSGLMIAETGTRAMPADLLDKFPVSSCNHCIAEGLAGKLYCTCLSNPKYFEEFGDETRDWYRIEMQIKNAELVNEENQKRRAAFLQSVADKAEACQARIQEEIDAATGDAAGYYEGFSDHLLDEQIGDFPQPQPAAQSAPQPKASPENEPPKSSSDAIPVPYKLYYRGSGGERYEHYQEGCLHQAREPPDEHLPCPKCGFSCANLPPMRAQCLTPGCPQFQVPLADIIGELYQTPRERASPSSTDKDPYADLEVEIIVPGPTYIGLFDRSPLCSGFCTRDLVVEQACEHCRPLKRGFPNETHVRCLVAQKHIKPPDSTITRSRRYPELDPPEPLILGNELQQLRKNVDGSMLSESPTVQVCVVCGDENKAAEYERVFAAAGVGLSRKPTQICKELCTKCLEMLTKFRNSQCRVSPEECKKRMQYVLEWISEKCTRYVPPGITQSQRLSQLYARQERENRHALHNAILMWCRNTNFENIKTKRIAEAQRLARQVKNRHQGQGPQTPAARHASPPVLPFVFNGVTFPRTAEDFRHFNESENSAYEAEREQYVPPSGWFDNNDMSAPGAFPDGWRWGLDKNSLTQAEPDAYNPATDPEFHWLDEDLHQVTGPERLRRLRDSPMRYGPVAPDPEMNQLMQANPLVQLFQYENPSARNRRSARRNNPQLLPERETHQPPPVWPSIQAEKGKGKVKGKSREAEEIHPLKKADMCFGCGRWNAPGQWFNHGDFCPFVNVLPADLSPQHIIYECLQGAGVPVERTLPNLTGTVEGGQRGKGELPQFPWEAYGNAIIGIDDYVIEEIRKTYRKLTKNHENTQEEIYQVAGDLHELFLGKGYNIRVNPVPWNEARTTIQRARESLRVRDFPFDYLPENENVEERPKYQVTLTQIK